MTLPVGARVDINAPIQDAVYDANNKFLGFINVHGDFVSLAQLSTDVNGNVKGIVDPKGNSLVAFDPITANSNNTTSAITSQPLAAFSPASIAGLTCWLDAQQPVYKAGYTSQCTVLGDSVGIIPDASGNNNLATAVTAPTYNPTGINGYPSIQFNGTNQSMTTTSFFDTTYGSNLTIFIVASAIDLTPTTVALGCANIGSLYFSTGVNGCWNINIAGPTGSTGVVFAATNPPKKAIIGTSVSSTTWHSEVSKLGYNSANTGSVSFNDVALSGVFSPLTGSNPLTIGNYAGTYWWNGQIGEIIVYKGTLTNDRFRQVYEYLNLKWGFSNNKTVICGGDSIIAGYGTALGQGQPIFSNTGTAVASLLWQSLQSTCDIRADATAGLNIATAITNGSAYADLLSTRGGSSQIYIAQHGTNTLSGTGSIGATIEQYTRMCKARKLAGYKIIAMTILPRADVGRSTSFDLDRLSYNAYLRTNWQNFADALCDIAIDSRLTNPNNTTYYNADKLHINEGGSSVVANLLIPIINSL